jgi:hypothetical protein
MGLDENWVDWLQICRADGAVDCGAFCPPTSGPRFQLSEFQDFRFFFSRPRQNYFIGLCQNQGAK